jgi:hypothetical protein
MTSTTSRRRTNKYAYRNKLSFMSKKRYGAHAGGASNRRAFTSATTPPVVNTHSNSGRSVGSTETWASIYQAS